MVSAGPCSEGWHCEPGAKSKNKMRSDAEEMQRGKEAKIPGEEDAKRRRNEEASEDAKDISAKRRRIDSEEGPATGGISPMSLAARRDRPVNRVSANFPSNCSETHGANDQGVNWEELHLLDSCLQALAEDDASGWRTAAADHNCYTRQRADCVTTITLHIGIWLVR